MTINLPITPQQAQNFLVLIDLAVKAGGLRVATEAVILQALISEAVRRANSENPVGLQPDGSGPG